ncbi:MAG TPA: hypothetical protein VLS93_05285 [Anaeromyxobacteraceae bacterium]|nr:hypothetical protein [Anaeromyxobacteraceae bacterium]
MPRTRLALLAAALAADALAQEPAASVVLRWREVPAADAYDVQIARDPSFAAPVVSERVPAAGFRWRSIPSERHWWRVRSVDAEGRPGPWSAVKSIEVALRPPDPIAPRDGAVLRGDGEEATVALSWKASELVREYAVEVARDPSFAEVASALRTPSARAELRLPGAGVFHWRVRAVGLDGGESAPSAPRSFSLLPPAPESPAAERRPEVHAPPAVAAVAGPETAPAAPAPAAEPPAPFPAPSAAAEAEPAPAQPPAVAGTIPGPEPTPASGAEPPGDPIAAASPSGARRPSRFGAAILAGWTTNFRAFSAPTLGAEALWRSGPGGLALSLRASWSSQTTAIPNPGLAEPLEARARIFPLSLMALLERPLPFAVLHAGAGVSAQLAHLSVGRDSVLEATAGVAAAAGASRRAGAGEIVLEASWSTGSVDGALGSLHTGGLQILGGYRFGP